MNNQKMNPWVPMANPKDLKVIGKLGEELGECGAAVSRCIIQGIDGREPVTGKVNRMWLTEEIADVLANSFITIDHFELNEHAISERVQRKRKLLSEWHGMLVDSPDKRIATLENVLRDASKLIKSLGGNPKYIEEVLSGERKPHFEPKEG